MTTKAQVLVELTIEHNPEADISVILSEMNYDFEYKIDSDGIFAEITDTKILETDY